MDWTEWVEWIFEQEVTGFASSGNIVSHLHDLWMIESIEEDPATGQLRLTVIPKPGTSVDGASRRRFTS